jgi:ribonuclease VapC
MTATVLDTSVILAAILGEPGGDAVFDAMESVLISSVSIAEIHTYAALNDLPIAAISAFFADTGIEIIAFDHRQAITAGQLASLTRKAGLSLGDRSCLALAKLRNAKVLTADRSWARIAQATGLTITLLR